MALLDTLTQAISTVINFGVLIFDQLYRGLKGVGNFIFQNFPFDNPFKVLLLFLIFFGVSLGLVVLLSFGAGIVAVGLSGDISTSSSGDSSIDALSKGVLNVSSGVPSQVNISSFSVSEGSNVSLSIYGGLCGDGVCERFVTDSVFVGDSSLCPSGGVYSNVPVYCFGGVPAQNLSGGLRSAYCVGEEGMFGQLSSRCVVENASLYYLETFSNCPSDCLNTCMRDLSCSSDSDCVRYGVDMSTCVNEDGSLYNCSFGAVWPRCCPSGSSFEGHCERYDGGDDFLFLENCNAGVSSDYPLIPPAPIGDSILLPGRSLFLLKLTPYHCGCSSDLDCVGDYGTLGSHCCSSGVHEGFCYPVGDC